MMLPATSPEVHIADFDTELVVLVPSRRRAHLLEPLVALLFDSCRSGDALGDVVVEVVEATGWDEATTETWLREALGQLEASGIVAPTA